MGYLLYKKQNFMQFSEDWVFLSWPAMEAPLPLNLSRNILPEVVVSCSLFRYRQARNLSDSRKQWFYICDALCDLVPFVQFKYMKNSPWSSLLLLKLQAKVCNFPKSNTPPCVFFTVFKLYRWYQIAQSVSYNLLVFI